MSDPSIPAHMSQRSQLDRTHAALGRHVEEEEALAELEGEPPSKWDALKERRYDSIIRHQSHIHAPQHDWLIKRKTPDNREVV